LPLLQIIKIIPKQIHVQLIKEKKKKEKKTKEEEAENSYRMGLWHFIPF
jgi:homoserine trans-succinylase